MSMGRWLRKGVQVGGRGWHFCVLHSSIFGLKVGHLGTQLSQLSFHMCCLHLQLGYCGFLPLARLVSSLAISDDTLILALFLLLDSLGSLSWGKDNLEVWNRLAPRFPLLLGRLFWLRRGTVG